MRNIILLSVISLLLSCNSNKKQPTADNFPGIKRPVTGRHESVGSLSFKLNGEKFEADPAHAKAWATTQIPLAMRMAKNDNGLSVSMQIKNTQGEGTYRLDGDSKGNVNFTVNGKTYWTKSVMKDDYLNLVVTSTKMMGPVVLLSGTFEGVLEDKDNNKVQITEGRFTTESL